VGPLDYIKKNKEAWNRKTTHHVGSEFYDMKSFLEGRNSLNEIELNLLENVHGKEILHLQCHFGQDTLSLARMGAKTTGVDFSEEAITKAKELNSKLKLTSEFVCCDVYSLGKHLDKKFDIVFTSYGTIGWLPDLDKWAGIVSRFLKPGGKFVFVEFHPVLWMFDEDVAKVKYNYFNAEPIIEKESGTYAEKNAPINTETVSWNHSLSEVMTALLKKGLKLEFFQEYDYSPYNCFNNMEKVSSGKYRLKSHGDKFPLVYSLTAIKE
jgi:ubiquinone/menaquinone biosynthesis C-methylase UbiE